MFSAREGPVKEEGKKDERFYEDAGDALAPFRKIYGGAMFRDQDKDPFGLDSDIIQSKRAQKLSEQSQSMGISE